MVSRGNLRSEKNAKIKYKGHNIYVIFVIGRPNNLSFIEKFLISLLKKNFLLIVETN
jgi:hypothetical protein